MGTWLVYELVKMFIVRGIPLPEQVTTPDAVGVGEQATQPDAVGGS